MDGTKFVLVDALLVSTTTFWETASLHAAVLLSPTSVLGTDLGEFSPQTSVVNMINQSGLDKPFVSGVTDFDTYFTTGNPPFAQANFLNNWQSEVSFTLPVMGVVDFDFGAIYSIDRLAIWNISLKDIKIHVSDTSINSLQEVASFALPNHLHFPFSYSHDLLNLGAAHDVRFMRIEIDSVYLFELSDTFAYAIVGEVVASAIQATAGIDGDYNGNGTVDAADYVLWRKGGPLANEVDTPGTVNAADYTAWRARFGNSGSGSGLDAVSNAPVPEPATLLLLMFAAAGWHLRRRPAAIESPNNS